jgi:hypothetical protein
MIESVLQYAARGLYVFPCQEKGKRPLTANGFKAATTDSAQIEAWWTQWPHANIGIATGNQSGIVVLDIDTKKNGEESLGALETIHGALPATVEVLTGNGRHLWFSHPGYTVHNSVGDVGEGLDIRGDGGYVIVPPSIHENGRRYEWEVSHDLETPLASFPSWLVTHHTVKRIAPDEPIREGSRNTTLFRMACAMKRQGMQESAIRAALSITNKNQCQPPLTEREVGQIARSANQKGKSMANKKVGVLWQYSLSDNTPYFSGYLDLGINGQVKIAVFRNYYKEGNQPDYHIVLTRSKEAAPDDGHIVDELPDNPEIPA